MTTTPPINDLDNCIKCSKKLNSSKHEICFSCRKHPCITCKKVFSGIQDECSTCKYKKKSSGFAGLGSIPRTTPDYLANKDPWKNRGFNKRRDTFTDRLKVCLSKWQFGGGIARRMIPEALFMSLVGHLEKFFIEEMKQNGK